MSAAWLHFSCYENEIKTRLVRNSGRTAFRGHDDAIDDEGIFLRPTEDLRVRG